jgi:hypothetical protein
VTLGTTAIARFDQMMPVITSTLSAWIIRSASCTATSGFCWSSSMMTSMSSRPDWATASMKPSRTSMPSPAPPPESVVIMPTLTPSAWTAPPKAAINPARTMAFSFMDVSPGYFCAGADPLSWSTASKSQYPTPGEKQSTRSRRPPARSTTPTSLPTACRPAPPAMRWPTAAATTRVFGQRGDGKAPTVLNAAVLTRLFREGRAPSLERQGKMPLLTPFEMAMPSTEVVVARVTGDSAYATLFEQVFPEGGPITVRGITPRDR